MEVCLSLRLSSFSKNLDDNGFLSAKEHLPPTCEGTLAYEKYSDKFEGNKKSRASVLKLVK